MIIRAINLGQGFMACCLAALVDERDFMGGSDPDIGLRLEILARLARGKRSEFGAFHRNRAMAVLTRARQLAKQFKVKGCGMEIPEAGRLLAFAWPERVAKKRQPGSRSYLMASGGGVFFRSDNSVSGRKFIVAVHVDGNPKNANIFMAAAYEESDLARDFSSVIEIREVVDWDEERGGVKSVVRTSYGKIMLRETALTRPEPGRVRQALLKGIEESGLGRLAWSKKAMGFRHRVGFLKNLEGADSLFEELPDLSDPGLVSCLDTWLAPFIDGISSLVGLKKVDLEAALKAMFTWEQLKQVETHAPTHVTVPSGSKVPLKYGETEPFASPVLAVRLQEMFGLKITPAVARGRVPVTLHLLPPASRPVQITRDLENFWANTYKEVKKDLMGRYPKHYWPEDPGNAQATARARPRKR